MPVSPRRKSGLVDKRPQCPRPQSPSLSTHPRAPAAPSPPGVRGLLSLLSGFFCVATEPRVLRGEALTKSLGLASRALWPLCPGAPMGVLLRETPPSVGEQNEGRRFPLPHPPHSLTA